MAFDLAWWELENDGFAERRLNHEGAANGHGSIARCASSGGRRNYVFTELRADKGEGSERAPNASGNVVLLEFRHASGVRWWLR